MIYFNKYLHNVIFIANLLLINKKFMHFLWCARYIVYPNADLTIFATIIINILNILYS